LLKDIRSHARAARFSREASSRNLALLATVNIERQQARIGLRLTTVVVSKRCFITLVRAKI
jgi:hypothetical protein